MNLIQSPKNDWDAFFKDRLRPATDVLLPTLAVLVLLLDHRLRGGHPSNGFPADVSLLNGAS
jgi:hypothetical protein